MAQIVQRGHIVSGPSADLSVGGMCAWRLPVDESCAHAARSLLRTSLTALRLPLGTVDDALLAASELATNALQHALHAGACAPLVPPELWVWARTTPSPQLVLSVFDSRRSSWPERAAQDPLDEHGRGLGIVAAVADAWGTHRSSSWLGTGSIPGKAVWCAFNLPGPWPRSHLTVPPMLAARHLASTLTARGVNAVQRHGQGVSLVTVPLDVPHELNVWVEPAHLSYAANGTRIRRPIVDLHDLAEDLVRRTEEAHAPA